MTLDITRSEEFKAIIKRSRDRELQELTRRLYNGAVVVYAEASL